MNRNYVSTSSIAPMKISNVILYHFAQDHKKNDVTKKNSL